MDINNVQLIETFQSIFEEILSQQKDSSIKSQLEKSQLNDQKIQLKIANIYLDYLEDLKAHDKKYEQFHGPRDFFSACKLICSQEISYIQSQRRNDQCNDQLKSINDRIIKAFYRHFSGLVDSEQLLYNQFLKQEMQFSYQFKPAELIQENLNEEPKFFISRHLMVISEDLQNSMLFLKQKLHQRDHQFFIGSDFSEDTKMQACYNVINKIVSCIEKGMIVILQNLDNIYQSLYEVLNQSYRYYNGKYFCKISFGAESSNIEVSKNFKLILLVNKNQVHRMDGPLLNRFEKHLLQDNTILSLSDTQNINALMASVEVLSSFQDIQLQNYNVSNETIRKQHPFFRFQNVSSVIQNYYLQYKLQIEQIKGVDQNFMIDQSDQDLLMKKIFHLIDFFQAYLPSTLSVVNNYKQNYIKSGYHFSLKEFIQNRIIKPDQDFLMSEQNILKREHNLPQSQVRQFTIFSPQTYIPDPNYSQLEIITLSQIASEQDLAKKISNFLNKGLPPLQIKSSKKVVSTFQDRIDFEQFESLDQFQSQIQVQQQLFIKQEVLIIIGDMSKQGSDSFDRIVFTMQKVDEQVSSFLSTVQQSRKNQTLTTQLNIILLLKVEEIFTMVPISGEWEFYYIENLSPFHQFKSDSQDHERLELFTYVKENLSLNNIFQNRVLQVQNIINFEALTKFFLTNNQQIFSHAYKDITYQFNGERSEFDYKFNRLEMITKIFSNNYLVTSLPVIQQMALIIMKHQYKIETIDDLVFSYLMPKGLSVQSSSLHTSIINGLREMIEKSLKVLIYHLESIGIIYGMANCKLKQFENYANNQILKAQNKYQNWRDNDFRPIVMKKNIIINESEEIFKVLQSYQVNIKNLQENVMIQVDDLFQTIYNSVRQNLSSIVNILDNFSEQILYDIQNTISPQIDPFHIQIAKAILLISRKEDQLNNLEEYSLEEINLTKYKSNTDFVIPIFLVLYIYKEQIIELRNLIKFYERFINQLNLTSVYVQMNKRKTIDLSESLNLFKEWTIQQIFDSIQPMSALIQQNQYLNQYYPTLSKPFLEYLNQNNLNNNILQYRDQIELVNIICTNFNNILEKKNLISSLNFDKIMCLDFKEIKVMKDQFYSSFKDDWLNNNQQIVQSNYQSYFDSLFIQKWNVFMKALIITSTEQGYFKGFDVYFIKILLDLELDEMKLNNNCLNLQFRMFLNRVFKSIKSIFTLENTQKAFNISSQELFCDNIGNPYHTEYYSLVLFSETIQKNIYKDLLDKKINETIDFLYILVEYNFDQLSTIQKLIYMSIFREFTFQMISSNNISESLLFQKIQQSNQNQMEIESEQHLNEQFMQDVNNLDKQLQQYFQNLSIQPLQIFIVKNVVYTKGNIQQLINNSFYLKGSTWLHQFQAYSFNEFYGSRETKEFINQLIQYSNGDYQQILEQIVMKYINNNNSFFKQMYFGNISSQMYYPMNMIHQIQSQVDFDTEREGDSTKSIYQCFKCKNCFIDNSLSNQQGQIIQNQIVKCSQCLNNVNLNDPNQVRVIQNGLSNKPSIRQIFQQERGFCLQLHSNYPNLSIKNCRPDVLRLFSMLYHTILNLSLKNIINNPLNQVIQMQQSYQNQNQIQQEQINISLINQILKLPVNSEPQIYMLNQIQIAFNQFISHYQQKQYNNTKIIHLIHLVFKFLLESQFQTQAQIIDLQNYNIQISQQIQRLITEFEQSHSNLAKAQLEEDFSMINLTIEQYYKVYPKSLRINTKEMNAYKAVLQIKQSSQRNNMQDRYPILFSCLEVDYLQQLSHQLNIFITFYQRTMIYFSNQFEQKQIEEMTLLQALNKLGKDNSESLNSFYVQKFVPCWNEIAEQMNKKDQFQGINYIPQINENTKLNNLIYSSKNGNTMFFNILQYLSNCQNKLIQASLDYCLKYGKEQPNVFELYSQIWIQFLDSQLNKLEKGLQDLDPQINVLKQPNLELLEKFCSYGQEEGDYIYERVLIEYESLQTNLVIQIFKGVCYIGLEKSLEFQFLPTIWGISLTDQMIIPQELIQNSLADNIKCILSNKDIAYETLQKMMIIYSFFKSSPIQQSESSLNTVMKQLNLRANLNKLDKIMEDHLKLKHLQSFIQLLEELNMNNLVQLCLPQYKLNQNLQQYEENILSRIWIDKYLLDNFKIIVGRFIIRNLSQENVSINPNEPFLKIIESKDYNFYYEQKLIVHYQLQALLEPLRICYCYSLYEKISYYQAQQQEQFQKEQINQNENNKLFIESFTDENSRKNIKQLTSKIYENK